MMRKLQITWLLPIILGCVSFCQADLSSIYDWKYIDYVWESDWHKAHVLQSNRYNYSNIIPNDVQLLPDGRYLLTTPKTTADNPASLSVVSTEVGDGGNLLSPYPDWSFHKASDCNSIISASRVIVDACNRLWVVDSGVVNGARRCSPKIMSFDLDTDKQLSSFLITSHLTYNSNDNTRGELQLQAVETSSDNCFRVWVYVADPVGHGLVIWDRLDIWRIDGDVYSPTSSTGAEITIGGETITLSTGPVGFYITPTGIADSTYVMFESIPSGVEYAASTTDLHNSKYSGQTVSYYSNDASSSSQHLATAVSANGILFTAYLEETSLVCRSLQDPTAVATLAQDTTTLQYVSSVKITKDSSDNEQLFVLSNRRQKAILGTMDFTETNFRVLNADVESLIENTVCAADSDSPGITIEAMGFTAYD